MRIVSVITVQRWTVAVASVAHMFIAILSDRGGSINKQPMYKYNTLQNNNNNNNSNKNNNNNNKS